MVELCLQVIVMDELKDKFDVDLVKKVTQRGVAMIATANRISLQSLIQDPDLNGLVGGSGVTKEDCAL